MSKKVINGSVFLDNMYLKQLPPGLLNDVYVFGDFDCHDNRLTSLEGAPRRVGGDFNCRSNPVKFTEEQVRAVCNVGRYVYV